MSRAKGPRLYLRRSSDRAQTWVILDGPRQIRTGCGADDRQSAERALAEYIGQKYRTERAQRHIDQIPIADVLAIYAQDVVATKPNNRKALHRLKAILAWWTGKTLAHVNGHNCRAYAAHKGNAGGSRRDLQDLSAAIQHHHREGLHREVIRVWLPDRGRPRDRWMTRDEIARLVWAAWRMREQMRRTHADTSAPRQATAKRTGKHIARAILFSYYTASRIGTSLTASWVVGIGRSYIDLERGTFQRLPLGKKETAKRQPPIRIPPRLLAHLRRWQRLKICHQFPVEWEGVPVKSIKTAFGRAVRTSQLGEVSPHTLRHSRVTHLMQAGIRKWEVAGYAGMSEKILEGTYGHHHPDHMAGAVNAR